MPIPAGTHSPVLAQARSLLDGKGRKEQGAFLFEGPTLLSEALRSGWPIEALFVTAEAAAAHSEIAQAERGGVPVHLIDERSLGRLSDVRTPSGIVARSRIRCSTAAAILASNGRILVLAGISDPGNAGTLLRSAEAFGFNGVVFTPGGVEPFHPKVVRSAMGSLFRLPLTLAEPAEFEAAAGGGWEVTGLDAAGEPIQGLTWSDKTVVVIGSERQGLGAWRPLCTRLAAIPMTGPVDSLNAAVAGSIALFQAAARRR